jgi:hypothetical protein
MVKWEGTPEQHLEADATHKHDGEGALDVMQSVTGTSQQ